MTRVLGEVSHGRSNNFNFLRVLAASGVIVSHSYPLTLGKNISDPVGYIVGLDIGDMCVLLFFATSGFFITASFDRCHSLADFFWARVLRIYPALLVMSVVSFSLLGVWFQLGLEYWRSVPLMVLENLTMFFNISTSSDSLMFRDNPHPFLVNGSLWTIKFEVLCYIGVFIIGIFGVIRSKVAILVTLFSVIVFFFFATYFKNTFEVNRLYLYYIVQLGELAVPFSLGSAAWVWRDRIILDFRILAVMILLCVALHGTVMFFFILMLTLSYFVLWFGYGEIPMIGKYNRFGDYSYGIYIYAFPIQQFWSASVAQSPAINTVASFLMALGFAILSWHFIEKPALSIRRKLRNPQNADKQRA